MLFDPVRFFITRVRLDPAQKTLGGDDGDDANDADDDDAKMSC
jgi:hypothetical protein